MRILLTYCTNSGSTFVVARAIRDALNKKHSVVLRTAAETTPEDIAAAEAILFGSPSWDFDGQEGQPHADMHALFQRIEHGTLTNKRTAVFGCGDTSYTFFCGAVDVLERWIHDRGGVVAKPSLRLNEFFFHEEENLATTVAWVKKLITAW